MHWWYFILYMRQVINHGSEIRIGNTGQNRVFSKHRGNYSKLVWAESYSICRLSILQYSV